MPHLNYKSCYDQFGCKKYDFNKKMDHYGVNILVGRS